MTIPNVAPKHSNRLTFHVGLHKTGSTSIQTALNLVKHRSKFLIVSPKVSGILADAEYFARVVDASSGRHVIMSDMDDAYSDASESARGLKDTEGDCP